MKNQPAPNNVIRFPDRKAGVTTTPLLETPPAPSQPKVRKSTLIGVILAVSVASGAVNQIAFTRSGDVVESATLNSSSRNLASVAPTTWNRDAVWERQMADKLASFHARELASSGLGRAATAEEKLKWGTLEEKYTITYTTDPHLIQSITLQDAATSPSYIRDRQQFLKLYGSLMQDNFKSAQLKSVELSPDKRIESYTLFDKSKKPKSEVHIELDNFKRLLSLKIEPPKS